MAEKKTKIDLKARLGKTVAGGAGPAALPTPIPSPTGSATPPPMMSPDGTPVPMPSSRPSAPSAVPPSHAGTPVPAPPRGIAPPPGISPGIPLPPFAPSARPAPVAAAKPTAAQQTIKVEIGEEVEQERKKASKRTSLYAAIAAVVGIGIGFVAGGAKAQGDIGQRVNDGAKKLEPEVKDANDKMKDLSDKLTSASANINNKTFPDELNAALSSINVPFDSTHLEGRQVGNFPGKVQHMLYSYTTQVEDLNKKKDALKNLLGGLKEQVLKAWKEEKDPMANNAVTFQNLGGKTVAQLVSIKTPYAWGKDPDKITILIPGAQRAEEKNATRWVKGDLTGSDPIAIPVDPKSMPATSNPANLLSKAIYDMRLILEGNKNPDDPTHETPGILHDGDDLATELHKLALIH